MRILKILGMAAAAGAATSVTQQLPAVVDPSVGTPIAAAIAATIAYILNPPKKR